MYDIDSTRIVRIKYTNYRGETAIRYIVPLSVRFASTEWHPAPQWLMDAFDVDKQAERSFALKDVHEWSTEVNSNVPNRSTDQTSSARLSI